MVIVAFQGKQIETPDPTLPPPSVSEYLKLEAEFHIHTETVVRGEVSQISKRLFKRMKVRIFRGCIFSI